MSASDMGPGVTQTVRKGLPPVAAWPSPKGVRPEAGRQPFLTHPGVGSPRPPLRGAMCAAPDGRS